MCNTAILCIVVLCVSIAVSKRSRRAKLLLPPGPPALPIVGNFHLYGRCLSGTSRIWPTSMALHIMSLRLDSVNKVVISPPDESEFYVIQSESNDTQRL
ncbi:hypothetical protein R1flu_012841 [Riccia fluitans]|uniref:Cytochrome P450 n=1 Tax=Riccia fluitans TaxID=41844 RepID=A0ABD1ZBR7_9MARC